MSEWLEIMLAEIARKQEEEHAAREEVRRRELGSRTDEAQEDESGVNA